MSNKLEIRTLKYVVWIMQFDISKIRYMRRRLEPGYSTGYAARNLAKDCLYSMAGICLRSTST